jgi:hypothetical protein
MTPTNTGPKPGAGPGEEGAGSVLWARGLAELERTGTLSSSFCAELLARDFLSLALSPAPGRPYGRRVLHASAQGEVMLAQWRTGQSSAPHDHGGARGAVLVLAGAFVEERFLFSGEGLEALPGSWAWSRGEVVRVSAAVIHDMTSQEALGLTLHFYAGEIGPARLFDQERRCTVHSRGGAWIPAEEEGGAVRVVPWSER